VLVDVDTGNVLAGHNERLPLPPASLTKVLVALIAVTYLAPDADVVATPSSQSVYPNRVGMEMGTPWPLDETLRALLVMSANDAAYAIAEGVSGSFADFASVMQRSAAQIGMADSPVLHDPAGLDGTEGLDGGNLVSARDLAIAGRDLLSVPELAQIVDRKSDYFVDPAGQAHYLESTNLAFMVSYPGAIGIKTGYTDPAGACVMAAATRDGRTMLAVVMNGYNPTQSAMDLLNQGFAAPVTAEGAADRLPAVALPRPQLSPREQPAVFDHRPPGAHARSAAGKPAGGASRGGKRAVAAKGVPGTHGRGALEGVISAWPAQLLLVATGAAALVGLSEVLRGRSTRRRRQVAPLGAPDAGRSPLLGPLGARHRRERLLASYTRHERPLPRRRP
jgi:D-alanyl-D-alanine carboxypeptidase (penicillin-binding protein 5/6)